MIDPRAELTEALRRYKNAAAPDLTYVGEQWPEFEQYLQQVNQLKKATDELMLDRSLQQIVDVHLRARRILRMTPIDPGHHFVGFMQPLPDSPSANVPGDLGTALEGANEAAVLLCESEHPGKKRFASIIGGTDSVRPDPMSDVRVVVLKEFVDVVDETLRPLVPAGVQFEVVSWRDARIRRPSCDLTVLFGAPENLVDWRIEVDERPRHISWVFNAPMSPTTLVVSWPGNAEFDQRRYEPTKSSGMFDARIVGKPRFSVSPPPDFDAPVRPRPVVLNPTGDETFDSVDFVLPDGKWISYGLDAGPRVTRIDEDSEFELGLEERVRPQAVNRGNTLIITKGQASRDLRRELCRQWVKERHAGLSPESAEATVETYRKALRQRYRNDAFISSLVAKGLREAYARNQLARAWDPNAMAPKKKEHFLLIATTAGLSFGDEQWEQIRALRGGFIAAGTQIVDWLKEAILADQSWQDAVDRQEIATVKVERLGEVLLAPVLGVVPDTVMRPLTQLGEIFS